MNDADTIDLLRAHLDDRHLTLPVDDVLARGRTLRRRRRRPVVIAAAVVIVAGGVAVTTTFGGSSPAFADWSATPETAPPAVVAAIDASCRAQLDDAGATLAVLDRRGANAVAVYTSAAGDWQCTRFQGSGEPGSASWWTQGGGGGPTAPTDPSAALEVTGDSAGTTVHEGSMTAVSGRVRTDVTQVTATVGARRIDAAIGGGAFDVWWPAVGADDAAVTLTATAADGTVLATLTVTVPGFGTG